MKDINGVNCDEYLGPSFSVNKYDKDGDKYECGIYLHYGHTSIRVAKTLRGFKAHVIHLGSMVDEIKEHIAYNS
uniref:Uncharacterized protein n=1 Tax=viral metagenome TaxID=1070528 RepID=A0A6M3LQ69_9ZZZZ